MKTTKRISAFIITIVLILGMLPVPAFAEDEPQVNDEGYYLLETAKDLMWFADKVNNGEDSINAELTANRETALRLRLTRNMMSHVIILQ